MSINELSYLHQKNWDLKSTSASESAKPSTMSTKQRAEAAASKDGQEDDIGAKREPTE